MEAAQKSPTPKNNADPSREIVVVVPDASSTTSLPKHLGTVISVLVILGIVLGFGKASLDSHKEGPHAKALSKDVYEEHVKLADERHTEAKEDRKAILGKLDVMLTRLPAPATK